LDGRDLRSAQPFEVKRHRFAVWLLELSHRRGEPRAQVLACRHRCRIRCRINDFVTQPLGRRSPIARPERQCAIVRHAIHKRSLGTLTPEPRQRLPEGKPDFLEQVVLVSTLSHVGAHEAADRRGILGDERIEGQTAVVLQVTSSGS
jgi:hypothetical protein